MYQCDNSGQHPMKTEMKSYTSLIVRDGYRKQVREKKLASPGLVWPNVKCNPHESRSACVHVNGNGVRKVVESVEVEGLCTDGSMVGGWCMGLVREDSRERSPVFLLSHISWVLCSPVGTFICLIALQVSRATFFRFVHPHQCLSLPSRS